MDFTLEKMTLKKSSVTNARVVENDFLNRPHPYFIEQREEETRILLNISCAHRPLFVEYLEF